MDSWQRNSPNRGNDPIMRPVQQVMSSPVDKWGLKALLYEIKTSIGKDRGRLLFGEELSELGVDLDQSEWAAPLGFAEFCRLIVCSPLYPTFATPWLDQSSLPRQTMSEPYHIPACYNLSAPAVESKIQNFAEETLFYAFYMYPQDLLQLEAAEELYVHHHPIEIEADISPGLIEAGGITRNCKHGSLHRLYKAHRWIYRVKAGYEDHSKYGIRGHSLGKRRATSS